MYMFFRKVVEIYIHLTHKVVIHGKENIPKSTGGYIIACNHQSYTDPPALASVFRAYFSFMAKSELFEKNKLFAWIIRKCGAFPVARGTGDTGALDEAIADIKKGRAFVIFPEGTRSKDGVIARGRSGCAVIAAKADSPVVPVCIMYGEQGKKRRLDIAIGEMIPAEKFQIDINDRKALRGVSGTIMEGITAQQAVICGEVRKHAEKLSEEQNADAE